jgi:hypothetical protein
MCSEGGDPCMDHFVIGSITRFKAGTRSEFKTRKKIRDKIKSVLNTRSEVRFFDTSSQLEVHVFVERNGIEPKFYWINSSRNVVNGFIYPQFKNRAKIKMEQFVIR